jgi:spermidine/putrescine transport system ATP-binding protein
MSKGRILQIGTPRDIYDRPSERFVANFIGETNFLEGEVGAVRDGKASIRLRGGATVEAGLPEGLKPSGTVTIVVRPEHADVVRHGQPAALTGSLSNIVYFGTDTHYHVALDGGGEFIVRHQNSRGGEFSFRQGEKVGIAFEPDAAQVLRD